jgi:DNA-binding MarR family transcriptional regulator
MVLYTSCVNDERDFMQPYLFRLNSEADNGLLLSRKDGRRVASKLRRLVVEPRPLVLDFSGITAATPSYLDELCTEIDIVLRRHRDDGMLVVATHLKDDVTESFLYILERHRHSLAYFRGDQIDLLNAPPHLVETLRAAAELGGEFTVPELAEALSVKTNAVNQRLANLLEAGAVARERDLHAERGVRYRYRIPSKQVLSA